MLDRCSPWSSVLLVGVLVGGCTVPLPPSEDPDPTSSTTDDAGSTTSGADETSSAIDSSGSDEGMDDDGPWPCGDASSEWHVIECPPDGGGVAFECDLLAQSCPDGEKCAPWANDGGHAWNATRCSRQAFEPDAPGVPCQVTGAATSGLDTCDLGSMCWNVDPVTLEGECVSMCIPAGDQLLCDDPDDHCVITNDGAIALCLPGCDPLSPGCASDEGCVPEVSEERWFCAPTIHAPAADGGPCEYINVCEAGSACVSPLVAPPDAECVGRVGCCAAVCELGGAPSCSAGTECAAWFAPGSAPPGLDTLGLCTANPRIPPTGWVPDYRDHLIADPGR